MATKAFITAEQYLATPFEWEPEFVEGELLERPLPTMVHGRTRARVTARLEPVASAQGMDTGVEIRVRVRAGIYRFPDIAVWATVNPPGIPTSPPLLIVEIASPDDRLTEVLRKLEEYRVWGVPHIWLVEPELKKFHVYNHGSVNEVEKFELPEYGFAIAAAELFA